VVKAGVVNEPAVPVPPPPEEEQEVLLLDDQVMTDDVPLAIEDGVAERVTIGVWVAATVTVVLWLAVAASLVQVTV